MRETYHKIEELDPSAAYEHYTPGYYAVFFAGPDGVQLEYVYAPVWPEEGIKGSRHQAIKGRTD